MTQEFPTPSDTWNPERGPGGKFLPGQGGRPKGSKNRFAADTMNQIKEMTPDALASLNAQVRQGNIDAVRFVLERVVGRSRMVELDGDQPQDITAALIAGGISTDEAKAIATVVEKLRRVQDMDALAERLDRLETILREGSI